MSEPNLSVEADILGAKINADVATLGRALAGAEGRARMAVGTRNLGKSRTEDERAGDEAEFERLVAEQNAVLAELVTELQRIRDSASAIQQLAGRLRV